MVTAYRAARTTVPGGFGNGKDGVQPTLTVYAYRNPGDGDLAKASPVKLFWDDAANPGPADPTENTIGAQIRPTLYAISPVAGDEANAIGITAAAIPEGEFGPVHIIGVVLCDVDLTDDTHYFATLTDSDTHLASATEGPGTILWRETGDVEIQKCWVLLNAGTGSGGSSGTTIPTVYATADLGGSPKTFTVREVHRNSSGVLVDDAGPVEHTAYEAQNRQPHIDTPGSPTREYPLHTDSNGKKYFQIDQYHAGAASPPLAGLVSLTSQSILGEKTFLDTSFHMDSIYVAGTYEQDVNADHTFLVPGSTSIGTTPDGTPLYFEVAHTTLTLGGVWAFRNDYPGLGNPVDMPGFFWQSTERYAVTGLLTQSPATYGPVIGIHAVGAYFDTMLNEEYLTIHAGGLLVNKRPRFLGGNAGANFGAMPGSGGISSIVPAIGSGGAFDSGGGIIDGGSD